MEIEQALEKYLVQLEADGRSGHTINQYRRHVRLFARWAHDVGHSGDVSAITHEHVARFLSSSQARIRPDGAIKKASSTNCLRTSIKGFFGYLHQAGYIRLNPTRLVRRALCGTPPPRGMTDAEAKRLMNTLAKYEGSGARRDHAMFHLMLATGIRLGSAVALDVTDVDHDRGELQLRISKGNRPDRVYLSNAIGEHLREFIGTRTTGPLFQARTGKRISTRHVQRRFSQWLLKAGIARPASVHSLRHSFATELYNRTGDLFLVQQALKHRSICSTLVYAWLDEKQIQAAFLA
jgi:integrase/recombinase XerC